MAETKFYFDFFYPLKVVLLILQQLFGGSGSNPETIESGTREWFSQPREGTDPGIEVVTTTFKLPLSVSEVTMEILRMPCVAEVWYQDRSNNWRPVLDMTRLPIRVSVAKSDTRSWYKLTTKCYPIVAKQLEFRIVRINDVTLENAPYPVGLRNCLIRRNVYDRSQGQQYFEEEQDVLGNIVSKYIKDWDATKANDDDPYTFWKSEPMPDPAAVASLYLDLRGDDGGPKTIDKVYIDPVYTGQMLNLYYSSDDTQGTLKLNPVAIRPDEDENTDWRIGVGRSDVSPPLSDSYYRWTMAVGPQIKQPAWIGIEWTPDFDPGSGPPQNPVLYRAMDPVAGQWKPSVEYDVGAGAFVLRFDDGTDTREYSAPMSQAYTPGEPLRIVAGYIYNPDTVYISVTNRRGVEIASLNSVVLTLPAQVSFDGQSEMFNFRGLVTALIVKLEEYNKLAPNFVISPDFEDTTVGRAFGTYPTPWSSSMISYSTDHAHSGTHSIKMIVEGADDGGGSPVSDIWLGMRATSVPVANDDDVDPNTAMRVEPGSTYYCEGWVLADPGNTLNVDESVVVIATVRDSNGVNTTVYPEVGVKSNTLTPGVWTKLSGHITIPAGYDLMWPNVEVYNYEGTAATQNIYYWDDVVFQRSDTGPGASFQNSATYYVDPDPVIPDANGVVPSTTLDNAIYAVSWTTQEHGSGGAHVTAFEDKEWTPIYRDYVSEKGMLFFPQAISLKYLKMEFTNLTEQPYPIYESGIETRYRVYPVSVLQQATTGPRLYTGDGGFLGLGTFISINGVKSVNFLNPFSILEAVGSILGTNYDPVQINQSNGYTSETLPNQGTQVTNVADSNRLEFGSTYVYRREALQPYVLAEDQYVTTIKAEGLQKLADFTDVPWSDIEAANPGAVTHVKSTGALPVRGTDWWVYPGQQLKIPANVMTKLTDTSTVLERKLTLESRIRFQTTSIHRYDFKTLKRDAAIAYFAGIREVIPFTSTFIAGEDKPYYDFPSYDPDQFVLTNTVPKIDDKGNAVGPITTSKKLYPIHNRLFERDLSNWVASPSVAWSWDGTTGRWLRGTAKCSPNGLEDTLLSDRNSVDPGEGINLKVSVKWTGLENDQLLPSSTLYPSENLFPLVYSGASSGTDIVIRWGVRFYLDTDLVSEQALTEIDRDTVASDPDHDWSDLTGSVTVPDGVNWFRIFLQVTNKVSSGAVWFESVNALSADTVTATAFKALTTASTFAKASVDFKDSGLWRSDSMWADINPDSQSIDDTALAYYTRTIPETIPGGKWSDTTKGWGGDDIEWGSPFSVVSVSVDANRRYQGKRVLHFRRAAGAGEAGIKVKQWNHFVAQGLFRIGVQFRKEVANDNQITLRLRRLADGVIVYEETVDAPTGRWVDYTTKFVEIPDSADQEYEVQVTLDGDAEDDLYLADLYTEIALVRYFVRLGSIGSYLHEVTDLRYIDGRVNVTVTNPVTDFSITATILAPEAWAYGARITPVYLK